MKRYEQLVNKTCKTLLKKLFIAKKNVYILSKKIYDAIPKHFCLISTLQKMEKGGMETHHYALCEKKIEKKNISIATKFCTILFNHTYMYGKCG